MRKTTEELALECGLPNGRSWRMETFRRLVIENERECAEAVEIDWPDYHAEVMGCGLEDRGIRDRYDAMRYGWDEAIERCAERIPENIFTFPPAAQVASKEAVPGWIRAVDEELVSTHLNVANISDTYEEAKNKLSELINWHIVVATDPRVNGGYKLVPIEPTETMWKAMGAYDGQVYSNPFDKDDFMQDYRAMLAAAPEVK